MFTTKILLLITNFALLTTTEIDHSIAKRSLLFPRATVLQFSFGVSAPLILPKRAINFSWVLQANYDVPSNLSQLQTRVVSAKSNGNLDLSRHAFYDYLEKFVDSTGLDGRHCLSRMICELAEHPMNLENREGVLEKILHFVLTPSLDFGGQDGDVYRKAEIAGKNSENCRKLFDLCPISILDLFTGRFAIFNK